MGRRPISRVPDLVRSAIPSPAARRLGGPREDRLGLTRLARARHRHQRPLRRVMRGMMRSKHEAATLVATSGEATPRIEIVTDRRRAHGAAFRTIVVAEASEPGARVQDVAARHGICPSLVYRWRRLAGGNVNNGSSVRLFPVRIAPSTEDSGSAAIRSRAGAKAEGTSSRDYRDRVKRRHSRERGRGREYFRASACHVSSTRLMLPPSSVCVWLAAGRPTCGAA